MANRTITIRILSGGKPVPTPDASTSGSSTPSPHARSKKKKKDDDKGPSAREVLATWSVTKVWSEIKAVSKQYVGKYFNTTENYVAQNLVANASDTIDFFAKVAMAGVAGAAIGGPIGAGIGIVSAVVSSGIGKAAEYGQYAIDLTNNAYGNYFYGRRAGLVDGGHGTEN